MYILLDATVREMKLVTLKVATICHITCSYVPCNYKKQHQDT